MYVISINPWNEKPLLVYRIPVIRNKNLTDIVLLAKSSIYCAYIVNKQNNAEYIWKIQRKQHVSKHILRSE